MRRVERRSLCRLCLRLLGKAYGITRIGRWCNAERKKSIALNRFTVEKITGRIGCDILVEQLSQSARRTVHASDPSAAYHGHAADLHAPTRTSAITCGYLDAMIMMVLINHGSGPIVGMAA